jgi:hypothetical protein
MTFQFGSQNQQLRFGDLGLKIIVTVSWFGSQNQASYGLLIAPQNQRDDDSVRDTRRDLAAWFAWKQVALEFFSLTSRLMEARLQVVHVTSSRRSRGVEVENGRVDTTGCVGPFYLKIAVFLCIRP